MHKFGAVTARPISRIRQDLVASHPSGRLAKNRWLLSRPSALDRLGQYSHASLGSGPIVQKPQLLALSSHKEVRLNHQVGAPTIKINLRFAEMTAAIGSDFSRVQREIVRRVHPYVRYLRTI